MALTSIADRLTPSAPIEITYGAQPIATGRKFTTIFGHRAATGGSAPDYSVYSVINVGDPDAAKAEVEAQAGVGSQIALMAYAFVAANAFASRSNFPAFRVVILPNAETSFGSADIAITNVKELRSDMFVTCYPTSDDANLQKLLDLCALISGPDRDLHGQFGSFVTSGSLDAIATQLAYDINRREAIAAALPDTNTALISEDADTLTGSNILSNIASTVGIYPGAHATGAGVPVGAVVTNVFIDSVQISANATATASAVPIAFQNVVSQAPEIVAAAHAAGIMSSAFPYNPLQGVKIGFLKPPQKASDRISFDPSGSSEAALAAGLSPMYRQPDGSVGYIRTRTTFTTLPGPGSVPATAYFDWQDIVVLYDFRETCFLVTQNPPFNNNPGGTKASQTIANLLKDEILREAQDYEDRGAFQGVQANAKLFLVQPSSSSRGRFDFKIPVNVLPGLYVIAGNIEAVSGLAFGDFTL